MSLADQALPLVGVAIGAAVSLVVSALNERTRWRRQQSVSEPRALAPSMAGPRYTNHRRCHMA